VAATAHPVECWRVLPFAVGEPRALLDEGVRLLEGLVEDPAPTLRWYLPDRTAIVLGRGQAAGLAVASTPDVTVLSRFSGGGAVLLDRHLLSLDVLLPAGSPLLEGDLGDVFLRVGSAWAAALSDLGVPGLAVHDGAGTARRNGTPRQRLLAAVCYATPGRGEVLAGGRKLVGLAQRRRRAGALVQCGLLRRWRPGPLLAALGADPDDPEIETAAIGLDDLCEATGKRPPSDEAVMAAVQQRLGELPKGPT
jgi:lipoate-protein ligase A